MNLSPFFEKSLVRGRGEGVQSLNLGQMYKKTYILFENNKVIHPTVLYV